ncbi:RNA 2'-phosphotransferase [Pseudoflavitalea sp. G-6-1-2]|uniref:RNA 2'-phosphotransferase n=1 Tax=Pseudoflavitalea sp. G-6-1-2 TaxID=2728841 RepID=UPI00146ECBEB|nr:RNA 2'-phosphotransferase [Pseudoflavitalea sp. G-6-1-2]NML20260.1 RNA 2'-phosphotransferase [Pseudoflavitalea sp. G-6-1-2]
MEKKIKHISKFMSLVLRHKPEEIGLVLDENGWTSVNDLIEKLNSKGEDVTRELIQLVVSSNDKKRFSFNEDQTMIRANQGHSIEVDLELRATEPPEYLYHGTATKFLPAIMDAGLLKRNRHHVHLTEDLGMAKNVGARHGSPVILRVAAKEMLVAGFTFYLSENNVWLVEEVPSTFLHKMDH